MRQEFRKGVAIILILLMSFSVFAAFPVVNATTYDSANNWAARVTNDPFNAWILYPGEQDVSFSVTVLNDNPGTEADTADLNAANVDLAVVGSAPITWDTNADHTTGINLVNGGPAYTFGAFQFDVDASAAPGTYNISVTLAFDDSDGTPATRQSIVIGYILFDIANNIVVANPTTLYAGQTYTSLSMDVTPIWANVNNLYLNLSNIPTGITFHPFFNLPGTTYWIPGTITAAGDTALYTIDVARDMAPGIYNITYQVDYTNPDNIRCTETSYIHITVEYTPIIEAETVGSTRIVTAPGASPIPVVEVRFKNTGTVDLADIDIVISAASASSTIYEHAAPGGYPTPVTPVHLDSLAMGNETSDSWYVDLTPYVTAGEDRILFDWNAHYLDNGSTGNPGGDTTVSCTWLGSPAIPVYSLLPGQEWIAGAYVPATALAHNTIVDDPDEVLYAGDIFADQTIGVRAYWGDISDVYLNLSDIPAGITFDETSARIPGIVTTAGSDVIFRVDVARTVAPGIYIIHYQTEYTNGTGARLNDTGTLNLTVDFTPIIEAEVIGSATITQGNASIPALEVRFTNTGNVDLRNIEIWPELDGVFFYPAVDFYEGADNSGDQNPQFVDKIQLDTLAQGTNTSNSWFIALDPYVQAGQHRILFDWSASYFDNGATGNNAHYVDVIGDWLDDDWDDSTPMIPVCDVNPGNEWIAGAYVMVSVNDDHPDFTAEKMQNLDGWSGDYFDLAGDNLVYVNVGTWINTFEMVQFIDIRATLQVGPGTPFLNPLNHSVTTVENDLWNSDDTVGAGNSAWMEWFVDIDPNAAPGIYTVNITLTGRNADTGEDITVTMQSVVEVRGFGPELLITSVTTGDINPGQQFTMNLTITNQGDDTARNVFVSIPDSFIFNGDPSQYWNVVDGFVNSISTYRDDYQNGAERETIRDNSNITLEQLNIKDAKDIVDLNLYIEGVYTHPAPTVWMVKTSNLAPGESITVTFQMVSNANMAPGRPYVIPVEVDYIDTNGNWGGWWDNTVTVQSTGVAEPYHATAGSQIVTSDNALGWGFLVVILILVLVLAWMFGPRRKEEEPMYHEEKPVAWKEPEPLSGYQEPAPTDSAYVPEQTEETHESTQEESIPEIAEMSVDDPAAVDAPAPSEEVEAPSDEVPLVYDEKENPPESF